MPLYQSWVHGNSAVPQFAGGGTIAGPGTAGHELLQIDRQPFTDVVGLPQGPGKIFYGAGGTDNHNWFHFSIPTPVWVADYRLTLERIFVCYTPDREQVEVDQVVVFDGMREKYRSNMALGGRFHNDSISVMNLNGNYWDLLEKAFPVLEGICISVKVLFHVEGKITFRSAGAQFR